ncbi:unnamed protein product [Moneuplotes crassus]|uniref:DUSP domain-containing protein n=1 Tax=Euplotes crassus TaxID=5936 RepID=A0AAD1YB41_EUPCR|nr:unnamed protein product [Moneuplotes crassus]
MEIHTNFNPLTTKSTHYLPKRAHNLSEIPQAPPKTHSGILKKPLKPLHTTNALQPLIHLNLTNLLTQFSKGQVSLPSMFKALDDKINSVNLKISARINSISSQLRTLQLESHSKSPRRSQPKPRMGELKNPRDAIDNSCQIISNTSSGHKEGPNSTVNYQSKYIPSKKASDQSRNCLGISFYGSEGLRPSFKKKKRKGFSNYLNQNQEGKKEVLKKQIDKVLQIEEPKYIEENFQNRGIETERQETTIDSKIFRELQDRDFKPKLQTSQSYSSFKVPTPGFCVNTVSRRLAMKNLEMKRSSSGKNYQKVSIKIQQKEPTKKGYAGIDEKERLEKAISMPTFFSNLKTGSSSVTKKKKCKISMNTGISIEKPRSQSLWERKSSESKKYQSDRRILLNKNRKYCVCRLLDLSSSTKKTRLSQADDQENSESSSFLSEKTQTFDKSNQSPKLCGLYCQHTSPEIQANIIRKVLCHANRNEEITYSAAIRASTGKQGDEKTLVNAKWWRDWCDYVNFETTFSSSTDQPLISVLNTKSLSKRGALNSHNALEYTYKDPGIIRNAELLDMRNSSFYNHNLKLGLQENHDYIAIPIAAWMYISSWYGYDFRISKQLTRCITNPKSCILNIYPDKDEYEVEISRNPSYYKYSK